MVHKGTKTMWTIWTGLTDEGVKWHENMQDLSLVVLVSLCDSWLAAMRIQKKHTPQWWYDDDKDSLWFTHVICSLQ